MEKMDTFCANRHITLQGNLEECSNTETGQTLCLHIYNSSIYPREALRATEHKKHVRAIRWSNKKKEQKSEELVSKKLTSRQMDK